MSKRKKNIVIENILVENYAAEGKCIAKIDGKVLFIEGAVPGDNVNVVLGKNKKDWAEARVTKINEYSKERVTPFCEHFGICGGCKWQMIPYVKQLQYKQQQVQDVLQRIGNVKNAEFLPIIGCSINKEYRNKLEFTFSNKRYMTAVELNNDQISNIQNVIGFHAPRLFDKVIDINHCHLQVEPCNKIRNTIREYAYQNNLSFYDIKNNNGFLRNMMVRTSTLGQTLVNIVFGENNLPEIKKLMDFVVLHFPEITSLHYTINLKLNDSLYDQNIILYKGRTTIEEKLEEFIFKISAKSFFQTNTYQAIELYKITRDFADIQPNDIVYDLYCGTGSIGIFCSKNAQKIIGVESVADAIEDAKKNAAFNNLNNTFFYAGDVIKICNNVFFKTHGKPNVIICDPPRAGMHTDLIEKLLEIEAPTIVYVSCNPATQARDLVMLQKKYKVVKVQAVDMFPHTHHVENVVQLQILNEL